MQLFNLIGRLTEEMKQLETDCVEMRAELTELKLKSNQASPVCQRCVSAKREANIDSQTIDHQSSEQNRAKGRPSGDHCSVPYVSSFESILLIRHGYYRTILNVKLNARLKIRSSFNLSELSVVKISGLLDSL